MARTTTLATLLQLALVVSMTMETGFCLHCYECETSTDERCADNPQDITECKEPVRESKISGPTSFFSVFYTPKEEREDKIQGKACMKYVSLSKHTKHTIVIRKCTSQSDNCEIYIRDYEPIGFQTISCDTCFNETCNGSSIPSAKLFLLVSLILYAIFFS